MAEGFTENNFVYAKYLKCILVLGCQTVQDIVRAIYGKRSMRTRNGTMPIREFNMRANVDPNYSNMTHFLDCNIMEENFDISFGYRLLQEEHICGETFNSFSNEAKQQISYLVGQRNKICHKYGEMMNYDENVKQLKACIKELYTEAKEKLNINLDSKAEEVMREIDKIMDAKVTESLGEKCLQDLEEFKGSLRFKLLNDGKDELSDYYMKLKTLNPCSWIDICEHAERFNIEKIFTAPKMFENKYKIDIPLKDLLVKTTKSNTLPNALLIKGLAGSGKTSLCRYLAHGWSRKTGSIKLLNDFDLVILLEVRRATSVTLLEFLYEELLSDTCYEFNSQDIIPLMQEMNLLFIIDGYDEESTKAKLLMEDILTNFQDKRFMVTSRLDYEQEIGEIVKKFELQPLPLTIEGFGDSEQRDFSEKVFEVVDRRCEDFLMYLSGRGRVLNKHLKLPLTMSLLIVLWMENPKIVNKITTATSLYYEIFCLYQKKLVERLIVNLKGRRMDVLKKKIPSLLLLLGEHAWLLLTEGNGSCELSRDLMKELEETCIEKNIDAIEFLSAFLMCEIPYSKAKTIHNGIRDKKYSFIHRTQMEYLAADFLAESVKDGSLNLNKIDQKVSDWRKHSEILIYLSGTMAKKNILKGNELDFMELTNATGHDAISYEYWWKILSESYIDADIPDSPDKPIHYKEIRHKKIAKVIYEKHISNRTDWHLKDNEVAAGLRLMSLVTPISLIAKSLIIDIPNGVDPGKIPDFYDALNDVQLHWEKKTRRTRVKVELYLRHHDSSITSSDQFLLALNKWGEIQNFSGILNNETNSFNKGYLKTVRCLVKYPCVLKSFENVPDSLRSLRLTIGFHPSSCDLEELREIVFTGALDLSIPNLCDEYLNWCIGFIRKLSRGDLENLQLQYCTLTCDSVMNLVKSMNGILRNTLYITRPKFRSKAQEMKILEKALFKVEWRE